jgi:hypothetical protein
MNDAPGPPLHKKKAKPQKEANKKGKSGNTHNCTEKQSMNVHTANTTRVWAPDHNNQKSKSGTSPQAGRPLQLHAVVLSQSHLGRGKQKE